MEDLAGDTASEVREQERGGVADVLDGDVAPQRRVLLDELQDLAEARDARGRERLDRPGRDPVDADALRPEARGEVAHRGLEARLGEPHRVVVRHDALGAEVGQRHQRGFPALHHRQRGLGERRKAVGRDVVRLANASRAEPVEELARRSPRAARTRWRARGRPGHPSGRAISRRAPRFRRRWSPRRAGRASSRAPPPSR